MSIIRDVKTYLISKGVSVPVFLGSIPNGETECIGLNKYMGQSTADKENTGLQVRYRAESYEEAINIAKLVCSILWEIGSESYGNSEGVNIDDTKYLKLYPIQCAYPLQNENVNYFEVVQNYGVNLIM